MMNGNNGNYTNFWNDIQRNTSFVDDDVKKPKVDHIALAGYRRAISNFVNIVTNRSDIPVRYQTTGDSYTDGKVVTIGSKIDEKNFDHVVGLALHEGSHVLLSDFGFLRNLGDTIPQELYMLGKKKGIDENTVKMNVKNMLNYVEDRRIDYYVFSTSPGYKGYYHKMYDKYFHSASIDRALKNNVLGNDKTWENYEARIINLTNKNSDLDALPMLRDIRNRVFRNVRKLKNTEDAFEMALTIVYDVYNELEIADFYGDNKPDVSDMDGAGQGQGSGKPMTKKEAQAAAAEKLMNGDYQGYYEAMSDIDSTDWSNVKGQIADIDNQEKADRFPDLTPAQAKTLVNALQKQKDFLSDDIKKVGKLSKKDNKKIKSMEESGVQQKEVGDGLTTSNWKTNYEKIPTKTNVIYIKKINQQMIDDDLFPNLFSNGYWGRDRTTDAVTQGTTLGIKLGKKLQVRGESRDTKNSRLDSGRIDKRLIAELGFGNERVFQHTFVEQYSDAMLHISVDASGSMGGSKWINTMTSVVAICKATSMIQNVDVVVSFRTTHGNDRVSNMPLVAIGYDSRVNKFSHITRLWPDLRAGGTTPEGLCYEAIMEEFVPSTTDRDSYFLNFSDGMPMFSGDEFEYYSDEAVQHTKRQVKKIINKGIGVMSYFVGDDGYSEERNMGDFKKMYGKDSQFIDLTNVTQIANSMNKKFLEK